MTDNMTLLDILKSWPLDAAVQCVASTLYSAEVLLGDGGEPSPELLRDLRTIALGEHELTERAAEVAAVFVSMLTNRESN